MKKLAYIFILLLLSLLSAQLINKPEITIKNRFNTPQGFQRVETDSSSFGHYLRNLKLKSFGSEVKFYDGFTKDNDNIYISVIDMEISPRDLQQCADAVMRLRGEYLFSQGNFDEIHFNFLSDNKPRYFNKYRENDLSYETFRKYMDYIFAYANTASLRNELITVKIDSMQIGDVFIQKGRPFGHAIIVVDMAVNDSTGQKLYMLAQSYMPAQETQILVNPNDKNINPWYRLKEGDIVTPEWEFKSTDLRRFK